MELSKNVFVDLYGDQIDIGATDIHNAVAAANWVDMALFDEILFVVQLGPVWNAADQLDSLHIKQAKTAAGGTPKAVVGKNLDQTAPNVLGQKYGLRVKAADLDTENGYHWVRLECAETGNTGVDNVEVVCLKYAARYVDTALNAFTAEV